MTKIQQVGLTTNSKQKLDEVSDRVDKFNRRHGGIFVELDYYEVPDIELKLDQNQSRYRLLFTFDSQEVRHKFWTE